MRRMAEAMMMKLRGQVRDIGRAGEAGSTPC